MNLFLNTTLLKSALSRQKGEGLEAHMGFLVEYTLLCVCAVSPPSLEYLRGAVKKKPSVFKDIVQIGGREVNPISKKSIEMIF